jgi:secondary thiamine-phosphate synthase enzyme
MSNLSLSAVEAATEIQVSEGTYKVASTTLTFETTERLELRSITRQVAAFVEQSPVRNGVLHVSSLHTTAGVMINETQGALLSDVESMFENLIPRNVYYKHNDPMLSDCDRRNADAHLRAVFAGLNIAIPIVDGKLKLGTWQNVILAEFDGPNRRRIHLQVAGI